VVEDSRRNGRNNLTKLVLDSLTHSFVDKDDPNYLGYTHEEVQAEMVRRVVSQAAQKGEKPRILVIGGGGYTLPRWVVANVPQVEVDVVEIDPGVTEMAHRKLGLPRDTPIHIRHMDGRQFVVGQADKGAYQLVIQDAVNDLSVPYHLMTKEYNDAIKAVLTKDGAYLLTVIDSFTDGELLRAATRTMKETWSNVQLVSEYDWEDSNPRRQPGKDRAVFVIYGSDIALSRAGIQSALTQQGAGETKTHILNTDRCDSWLNERPRIILTDQYAPVDNLMSRRFSERYGKKDEDDDN
jgi:spermidine synthase